MQAFDKRSAPRNAKVLCPCGELTFIKPVKLNPQVEVDPSQVSLVSWGHSPWPSLGWSVWVSCLYRVDESVFSLCPFEATASTVC